MDGLEITWYLLAAGVCLLAVTDWRKAIFAGMLFDVLRDPVRKLVPLEPVLITLSVAVVWAVIVTVAVLSSGPASTVLTQVYPKLRTAVFLLIMAILPAAAISLISYSSGWKLAAIGLVSYMAPAIGVPAGFCFLRKERDLTSLMKFYVLVNSVMLVSVIFEYLGMNVPAGRYFVQLEPLLWRQNHLSDVWVVSESGYHGITCRACDYVLSLAGSHIEVQSSVRLDHTCHLGGTVRAALRSTQNDRNSPGVPRHIFDD